MHALNFAKWRIAWRRLRRAERAPLPTLPRFFSPLSVSVRVAESDVIFNSAKNSLAQPFSNIIYTRRKIIRLAKIRDTQFLKSHVKDIIIASLHRKFSKYIQARSDPSLSQQITSLSFIYTLQKEKFESPADRRVDFNSMRVFADSSLPFIRTPRPLTTALCSPLRKRERKKATTRIRLTWKRARRSVFAGLQGSCAKNAASVVRHKEPWWCRQDHARQKGYEGIFL